MLLSQGLASAVLRSVTNSFFFACVVPSGGEDRPKAAAGVCGIHRIQCCPAHKGCEWC